MINFDITKIDTEFDKSVVLDGDTGEIFLDPTSEVLKKVEEGLNKIKKLRKSYNQDSITDLGIELRANIGSSEELNAFNDDQIKSVGLFRSEFVYIDRSSKSVESWFSLVA